MSSTVDVDGRRLPALIFPVTYTRAFRMSQAIWTVVFFGVAAAVVAFLFVTRERADAVALVLRVLLVTCCAWFVQMAIWQVVALTSKAIVAVTTEGIYSRGSGIETFVPWAIITAAGPHTFAGCRYFGLRTSRPPESSQSWLRMFRPLNRRAAGWDLTYPVFLLARSSEFEQLVQQCAADPTRAGQLPQIVVP